jgi:hypothetical protein
MFQFLTAQQNKIVFEISNPICWWPTRRQRFETFDYDCTELTFDLCNSIKIIQETKISDIGVLTFKGDRLNFTTVRHYLVNV